MKTTTPPKPKPNGPVRLALTVQYAVKDEQLSRWRLRRWVQKTLDWVTVEPREPSATAQITLRLVNAAESQTLNNAYRSKNKATNVLTFAYHDPAIGGEWAADVVICTDVLKQEAREQGKAYLDHAAHLVVHGTLHALGYDHIKASDATEMEALERAILAQFSVADPYRTQTAP